MSQRWAAMLGYTLDELAPIARYAQAGLYHPDDLPQARAALQRYLRGELPHYEYEHRMRHRDGRWIWIQARGSVSSRTADGRAEWISGVHIDVTERREAAQRWQARAELSGDWFWQTDALHRVVEMSVGESQRDIILERDFIGLRRDQIPGIDPPEEGWAAFHERLDRHEAFKAVCYLGRTAAGEVRWREIDGRPRFDDNGSFIGYEGVGRDVTERHRITENLRESLALIDALFEAIPIPVALKDRSGRYLRMNRASADLFGASAGNVLGHTASDVIDEAAARRHAEVDRELLQTPGVRSYEIRQQLSGGRTLDALVSKASLLGPGGAVVGLVFAVVDISQLKAAERAMAEAKEAAEAANSAKSAFLATMSHEIRTPMNGVVGMAEILAHSALEPEQAQTVRTIIDSAHSLLRLIDDILDFSKIEAGRLELESVEFELTPLVEGVCMSLAPLAGERNVHLSVHIDSRISERVAGDPTRVRQLLNNLVGNAIKFSVGTPDRPGSVSVNVQPGAGGLRIVVSDNGIGMSQAELARLFTPFTQAKASTTRRFGGTGLGLAICGRLVEMMNGRIDVTSEPGRGSTFALSLPLPPAAAQPLPDSRVLDALDCVIVDGPELPAHNLQQWLERAGATVCRVASMAEVLQAASLLRAPTVLVHADPQGASTLPDLPGHDVRQLLILHGRRETVRLVSPTVAEIDLLRREPFVRAVAIVAGRSSPDVVPSSGLDILGVDRVPPPTVAQARSRGQLILVAEDDATNRAVLSRQLGLLGYAAEFAENGRLAFKMWRDARYALLLTDLHMPEMDGYELANSIRRDEGNTAHARLPILALTANALKGEAARARAAGMDDYLTKPVPLKLLQAALNQWMPPPVTAAAGPLQDPRVLELNALRQLIGDDEPAVRELLVEFLASARGHAGDLHAALQSGAPRRVAGIAHKLKSAARSVGALALSEVCAEIEASGRRAGAPPSGHHRALFEVAFAAVEAAVQAHLNTTTA